MVTTGTNPSFWMTLFSFFEGSKKPNDLYLYSGFAFSCFYLVFILFLGAAKPNNDGASRGSSTTNFWLNDDKFLVERRQISG
jgi:hypothetical protein